MSYSSTFSLKLIVLTIGASLFLVQGVVGCTIIHPKMNAFDPREYIFLGEVVGTVGPLVSAKGPNGSWGLKVRVTGAINLPRTSSDYFEVYPFELDDTCRNSGAEEAVLLKHYPIGSRVRVVGTAEDWLNKTVMTLHLRLEVSQFNWGLIARNDLGDGFDTTTSSVYDYRKDQTRSQSSLEAGAISYYSRLGDFELRKDFRRISQAKRRAEKMAIYERIADYRGPYFDFKEFMLANVRNKRFVDELIEIYTHTGRHQRKVPN